MTTPNFPGSQEVMILTARSMWTSCKAQQLAFVGFSPRYTILYIDGKLTAIDSAETLPNEQQRQEAESTARVQLVDINSTACANWQLLKRYIAKAYPANLHQTKWNAAGMADYEEAANDNWESSKKLMRLGNDFITANLAALTLDLNMPPTFPTTFSDSKDAFDSKLAEFITAEQTNSTGGEAKIIALNNVYTDLIEMGLDGQELFATNDSIKKQFTFDQVQKLYAGNGDQGYKGIITNAANSAPIKNAKVSVQGTPHSTLTDAAGNYAMRNVAHADNQTIIVECDGFKTATIPGNKVDIGIMTTLNITLAPNP